MKKKVILFIFFLITLLYFSSAGVYAVTTAISNPPTNISSDEFTIDVVITGASSGVNYLRIDLFKPNTTNYFGETYNGSEWYSESDFSKYFPVNIVSGTNWSGQLKGRIGNVTSTQYDGSGSYKLRVRRYTPSGNYNTAEANNSIVETNINLAVPTSTQIPSPTEEVVSITPTVTLTQEIVSPTLISTPADQYQTYNNVYISEVMINPENTDSEWIELYNENDFITVLDNWFIDDLESGGGTPKKISLSINAKNYAVLEFTSSLFNNDKDSVRLLDAEQKEIDSFQYDKSEKGKTLGRTSYDSDSFCLQNPSYGIVNNTCLNPTSVPTTKSTITLIPTYMNSGLKTNTSLNSIIPTNQRLIPTDFLPLVNYQVTSTPPAAKNSNNILGITTKNNSSESLKPNAVVLSFSFASFGYSSLAGFSLFYKLRKNLTS